MPGKVWEHFLDLLYPRVCPCCGKISPEGICDRCRGKIITVREPVCMRCGKPLRDETQEYCMDCRKRFDRALYRERNGTAKQGAVNRGEEIGGYFTQGRGLWVHREPVSGALYRFKYKNKRYWGKIFAAELAERYKEQIRRWEIEEIIPVPLHVSRRRKRGFNQAELIAEELACQTGLVCRKDVLFRVRRTTPQKKLDARKREENLRAAFAVARTWKPCKNVLIIDDIYTTGATIERAAKILRIAGAQNVYFLTISIGQGV